MFFEVYGLSKDKFLEIMEVYNDSFDGFFLKAKEMFIKREGLHGSQAEEEDDYFTYIEDHFMDILANINFEVFRKLSIEELALLDSFLYEMIHLKLRVISDIVLGTLIQSLSDAVKWYFDDEYIDRIASKEMLAGIEDALNSYYDQVIAYNLIIV